MTYINKFIAIIIIILFSIIVGLYCLINFSNNCKTYKFKNYGIDLIINNQYNLPLENSYLIKVQINYESPNDTLIIVKNANGEIMAIDEFARRQIKILIK